VSFSQATAVVDRGDGRYDARIAPGWDIAGNANGGYLLAIATRAMQHFAGQPDPVTVTAHYLRPGTPGPVAVLCERIKEGKRFTTVSATLLRDGRPLLRLLGAFGSLAETPDTPERVDGEPPQLPPVEACIGTDADGAFDAPAFHSRIDLRLHPDDAGFRRGQPSGEARMRGWFRLRDGEALDGPALLLGTDAFPPTVFNARLPVAWTPTMELTGHLRKRPVAGWLRAEFRSRFVTGGFVEEDGELWDADGRLVAQSRQLALIPRG